MPEGDDRIMAFRSAFLFLSPLSGDRRQKIRA
jgi:hypothetical protein